MRSRWLRRCVLVGTLVVGNFAEGVAAGDGLQELQTEARSQGPFESPPHWEPQPAPSQVDSGWLDDDDEGSLFAVALVGAVVVASAPFWGPASLMGDDYNERGFFPRYPYQEPVEGYLMIEPYVPRKPRDWSGRVSFENGGDFDDLIVWNGRLLLETTSRWGMDVAANYLTDRTAAGVENHAWIGDSNLVFRFAQSPRLVLRTGIGFNWLDDATGSDFGFNFTYGGDWFPINPLIVSSEIDFGEIAHASLFHARITTGVQWHRGEVYAGYDYLDVGNAQLDSWIAGLRFWF